MGRAGASAQIVRFWRAVEMFSPPSIRDKPSWDAKVFALEDGQVPPWDPAHPLRRVRLEKGKVWRHTVYGGIFELERLRDVVVGVFGDSEEYRDTRADGVSAVFALTLGSSGALVEDSEVLSACAWAVGRTVILGPRRGDWLDGSAWDEARKQFSRQAGALGGPAVPGAAAAAERALAERVRTAAGRAAAAGVSAAVVPAASAVVGPVLGGAAGKAAGTFAQQLIDPDEQTGDAEEGPEEDELDERRSPVSVQELFQLLDDQAELLGVTADLAPVEIWVQSRQVSADAEPNSDSDFLNSFILTDLDRAHTSLAAGAGGAVLDAFLRPGGRIDVAGRVDLRRAPGTLLAATMPAATPGGRWVTNAEHGLALSQQFAVNQLTDPAADARTPVFAVNGPPGTGKTTMLRDVVAALVVERATHLAALSSPSAAFTGKLAWSTEAWRREVRLLRPELTGYELVVACAGNGAAKNITHEFPGPDGIDPEWREMAGEVDYFQAAASIALELEQAETDKKAWAAVAGALGNMELRRTFHQRFWWGVTAREEATARREKRAAVATGDGLGDLLSAARVAETPVDWTAAVNRFTAAKNTVDTLVAERQAAYEAMGLIQPLSAEVREAVLDVDARARRLQEARSAQGDLRSECSRAGTQLAALEGERDRHVRRQPGLWVSLSTRGKAGREWHDADKELAARIAAAADDLARAERDVANAAGRAQNLERELGNRQAKLASARRGLAAAQSSWKAAADTWPKNVPSTEVFDDAKRRELLAPWSDPEIAAARTRLFLEALRLHKQFLLANAPIMRRNLSAAFDLISGNAPADIAVATAKAAWQSLFLAVPVVSTTFASMGRLFAHLGASDLGWVMIDEAGQATPQNAIGALWRAKRAVIVGDPLQLEPVVAVPHTLQQALREHFSVDEEWLPGWTSVQAVADRLAPHGTYLETPSRDGAREQTWVGAPLRVHRRCDDPMFTISNLIAYRGLMVNGKHPVDPEHDPYLKLRQSCWVDVRGAETHGTWIPAEGERLRTLIAHLIDDQGVDPSRIRVISPFRNVVKGVKDLKLPLPGKDAVGTIHTMQGKEADIVFLVLGGGKKGQRGWASDKPNLLNVAVSRAKRRLFVIGDYGHWRSEHYFDELAARLPKP
jgi:AAA domain